MNTAYRSPKTLSYLAIGGLAGMALLHFLSAALSLVLITTNEIHPEDLIYTDDPDGLSIWLVTFMMIGLALIFIYVATIVFFLVWLYRAASNLAPLKAEMNEYTPGWAVGWWFVPFANLIKPFHVVREIWCESDPEFEPDAGFMYGGPHSAPTFMVVWWILWISSNIISNGLSRIEQFAAPVMLAESIVSFGYIIAAVLAIMIVKGITDRQDKRSKVIDSMSEFVVPPPPVFNSQHEFRPLTKPNS